MDGVKTTVEAKIGSVCALFQALTFTTQVVAGVNYIVKTKINADGNNEYTLLKCAYQSYFVIYCWSVIIFYDIHYLFFFFYFLLLLLGACAHIKIHKPLPHTGQSPSVMDVATGL